jgi:hypothetical protein
LPLEEEQVMAAVTLKSLEARVKKLEETVTRLLDGIESEPIAFKDWRKAVAYAASLPPGDEEFRRAMDEEIRQLREQQRQAAIEEADREEAEQKAKS